MKKSEIKIFKEEYEEWKAELLYHQKELKLYDKNSNKNEIGDEIRAEIIADISASINKIDLLEYLASKLNIENELGI